MFEFLTKLRKSTGKVIKPNDNTTVNKNFVREIKDTYQVDDFYTSIINSIQSNNIQTSLDTLLYLFNNVSEINSIVTYIAQKGADIPIKHVKLLANGKEKDLGETELIKKLKKPNFLKDGRTFMIDAISSYFIFGFIPINKIVPIGWTEPSELFIFPGNQFYTIPQKHVNQYGLPSSGVDFRLNPIVKYRLFIDNIPFDFSPDEIIMINDSNITFSNGAYLRGQSRLFSAIRSIKTLSYIYDLINTLIANKGAEGFLVKKNPRSNAPDAAFWDPDDKKNVEDRLYSYGTTGGRRPIGVSQADLGFIRLSVPISEFIPIELKEHEFRTIATALLFPSVLLNDKDSAIYNNVSLAQKAFYTDCLMPIVNLIYQTLTYELKLNERGEALRPIWDDIECLQADKKLEAETNKVWNEVFEKLWTNNMITKNQWLNYLGLPEISDPDFNKRKDQIEPKKTEPIEEPIIEPNIEENANTEA